MKNRFVTVLLLIIILVSLTGNAQAKAINSSDNTALVYVKLASADAMTRFSSTQLPMYASLDVGILTGADQVGQVSLWKAGLEFTILDPQLEPGKYYLASTPSSSPALDFESYGRVLLKTANGVLLRMDPSQVPSLAGSGAELRAITLVPKPLPVAKSEVSESAIPAVIEPDPLIQHMVDQVTQTQVYTYDNQLAGFLPVWVDGAWYTIPSRYTYSGTPIQKATHFVGQHMQSLGMSVEYQQWLGATYPNVIGQITGSTNPQDIYIIGAHLDDVQGAPGADDNASGSAATLLAADILSQYQWSCTLRFAFWTGEEQGLLGSAAYAQRAYQQGENILGYLNLDMLAWNTLNSDPYINLFYSTNIPATYQLALLFQNVIGTYNIDLLTRLGTNLWGSDHNSFWDYGFNSILAIEDDLGGDFNPYYHSSQDTPFHTDAAYFTNFVKASVATFAHETGCLIHPPEGQLAGHVTVAVGGSPLEGATVTAENHGGHAYPSTTDASGYYTMTLPADTYTVTASAAGFLTDVVTGVQVVSDTTTTLDFALETLCEPVTGLAFTWEPKFPYNGDPVSFTATANGTGPLDFQWDFGDTLTGTGSTVTHTYTDMGTYTVALTTSNACSTQFLSKDLTVLFKAGQFFLPLIKK